MRRTAWKILGVGGRDGLRVLVELSAAALVTTLQTALTLDPSIELAPSVVEALNALTPNEHVRITP
jgi:hypothetical protein